MVDIIDVLTRERSQLVSELSLDPRFVKLQKIDALLAEYKQAPVVIVAKGKKLTRDGPHAPKSHGDLSKRERIESAVHNFLAGKGLAHRREILEYVRSIGLIGEETKDPMARLAIYLSDMNGIRNDGTGNWSLIKPPSQTP